MRELAAVIPTHSSGFTTTSGMTFAGEEPEGPGEFAVVRPLPVIDLDGDDLVVTPLEYSSIASRPEPVRVI